MLGALIIYTSLEYLAFSICISFGFHLCYDEKIRDTEIINYASMQYWPQLLTVHIIWEGTHNWSYFT